MSSDQQSPSALFGEHPTPGIVLTILQRSGVAVQVTATAWRTDAQFQGSGEGFDEAILAIAETCPLPLPESAGGIREKLAKLQFAWIFQVSAVARTGDKLTTKTAYPETAAQQLVEWFSRLP